MMPVAQSPIVSHRKFPKKYSPFEEKLAVRQHSLNFSLEAQPQLRIPPSVSERRRR